MTLAIFVAGFEQEVMVRFLVIDDVRYACRLFLKQQIESVAKLIITKFK